MPGHNPREAWIDIAKGVGILAVVAGHAASVPSGLKTGIFWFHMPLFFALSGYLFKPVATRSQFSAWMARRAERLLLPYLSFLVAITTLRYAFEVFHGGWRAGYVASDLINIALGGRFIGGYYGIFWFVTCLFATQIVFAAIMVLTPARPVQIGIIATCYALAHVEAAYAAHHHVLVPWNIDVVLIALAYYALGYAARSINLTRPFLLIGSIALALVLAGTLMLSREGGLLDYQLDLKYLVYVHPILDIVVPAVLSVGLCAVCMLAMKVRWNKALAVLGSNSMVVMYLHQPINQIVLAFHLARVPYTLLFGATSLIVPLAVSYLLFGRFAWSRRFFLGAVGRPGSERHAAGWSDRSSSPRSNRSGEVMPIRDAVKVG